MDKDEKWFAYQAEVRLIFLFQQCLRDLGLPLDYLHTEDGKDTDFKRQQVGVALREAFQLGKKTQEESQLRNDRKNLLKFLPKKYKKLHKKAMTTLGERG